MVSQKHYNNKFTTKEQYQQELTAKLRQQTSKGSIHEINSVLSIRVKRRWSVKRETILRKREIITLKNCNMQYTER